MKRFIGASSALAVLLAGCGGGGGFSGLAPGASGGAGPSTGPNPGAPPTPNPHPVLDGAVVTFVRDESSTDVRPSPVPTIAPTSTIFTATIHTGVLFNGHAAFDVQSTSANGNEVHDNYEGFENTPSGQNYVQYGNADRNPKQQLTSTLTNPDVLILDELPEVPGARWTNSDAINFTLSSGPVSQHLDETEVRHADGSDLHRYTYSDGNPADTVTDTNTVNPDGTASQVHQAASGGYSISFGVPVQKNGTYVIPTTYTDQTGTQSFTATDWYPGNALPSEPFDTITAVDLGIESLPPSCNKAPQLPVAHVQLVETLLDPSNGSLQTRTADSYYAPSRGLVCSVLLEVRKYYDLMGTLEDTQTYVTVYALTSGTGILSDKRHATSFGASFAPSAFPIQALRSRHMRAGKPRR